MGLSRKLLPWFVLVAWVMLTALAVPLAGKVSQVAGDSNSVELPRGDESTQVAAMADRFPDSAVSTGIVVYARSSGLTDADRAKVDADRVAFAALAAGDIGPARPSRDGQALSLSVPLRASGDTTLSDLAGSVRDQARQDRPDGLDIRLTGAAGAALDARDGNEHIAKLAMFVTAAVVMVLLLVIYRSPVLWLLPLLSAGIALVAANAIIYLLGRFLHLTVDTGNTAVVTVLVFGVGTDYALLLLSRYREELRQEHDRWRAMARALRGAVPAIAASAATVSLGLLCLLAARMGFNYALGPAGAVAVACGFVVMTTLFPAVLVLAGRWIFWPAIPRPGTAVQREQFWGRLGHRIARRPRLVWIGTALALGVLALGALGMKTGLDQNHIVIGTPDSVAGQRLVAAHYAVSTSKPVQVVVDSSAAASAVAALRQVPGVASVAEPVVSSDRTKERIDVTLALDGNVDRVRAAARAVPGAHALVGGAQAVEQAKAAAQAHDREVVIPLVLAVVFLVLMVLLRAFWVPLLLLATVVLSYFATIGVGWQVLRHAFGFPAMDIQVMLVGFMFLVALGVDYNIFLVSRIRQEDSVVRGLALTGGVITSAGVVLAATFSVLMLAPYVAFVEIGFVVAVGVLIDTLVVRSVLVPALLLSFRARDRHHHPAVALPDWAPTSGPPTLAR